MYPSNSPFVKQKHKSYFVSKNLQFYKINKWHIFIIFLNILNVLFFS